MPKPQQSKFIDSTHELNTEILKELGKKGIAITITAIDQKLPCFKEECPVDYHSTEVVSMNVHYDIKVLMMNADYSIALAIELLAEAMRVEVLPLVKKRELQHLHSTVHKILSAAPDDTEDETLSALKKAFAAWKTEKKETIH